MRLTRALAVLVALALLAACQPDAEPVTGEDLVEQAREALDELSPDESAPDRDPPPQPPPQEEAPPGDAEPPAAVDGDRAVALDERAGLGGICRAYLRSDVARLVVEVGYQAGAQPSQDALDHLMGVLRSVVDKPGGVSLAMVEIPGGPQTWTRADLESASRAHRQHTSGQDQVVMHVLSLRGEFEERDAIGVAFDASTFASFPDRIDGLATLLAARAPIERAVLVHEAGHLLCLINNTYTSAIDHEDPEHPRHSGDQRSVMYWAVENSAVAQVFSGPPPDDFNDNDRADLDGLRTGRY